MMDAPNYWQDISRRRVSRRKALKAGATAGIGAAALGLLRCGGDDGDGGGEGTPTGPTPAADQTPVPGGKATFGLLTDPANIDPQLGITAPFIAARIHNPLHVINLRTQEFQAVLAEKLEQPDKQTYVWTLRPDVKYQDLDPMFGRKVTAQDVVYSFERLKANPGLADRKLMTLYAESLEAVDDATFKFRTNRLFSPAIYHTGNVQYCVVGPEAVEKWGDLTGNGVGNGGWMLDTFVRGERLRLMRNPDYWWAGRPFPDEEEWLTIPDSGTAWQAYKTGKLDFVALNMDKFKREEVENNPAFQVQEGLAEWKIDCYIRVDRGPLSDPRVREALDIAINRDDAIEKMYYGEGRYNGPMAWTLVYWSLPQEELKAALKYDPEKAKQLLSAAGYEDGLTLNAPVMGIGDVPKVATIVQDHYSKVGVTLDIQSKELATYLTQYLYASEFEITFFQNRVNTEPDLPLRSYYSKGQNADVNPGRSNDPEVDALLEGGWEIFDLEEKKEYYLEVQRKLLTKHGPMYPLFSEESHVGYSGRMRGLQEGTGVFGWLGASYWIDQG